MTHTDKLFEDFAAGKYADIEIVSPARCTLIKFAMQADQKEEAERQRYEEAVLNICVDFEKRGERITKAEAAKILRSYQTGTSYAAAR